MRAWLIAVFWVLTSCASVTAAPTFPIAELQVADFTIPVQLAATPELRARGLMFQEKAEPGMLLVYRQPEPISLWMRNTSMPLDVAFIDGDWKIHVIKPLEPFDETPISSDIAVIAALEMPRGWFEQHNVIAGAQLRLLTRID